MSDALATLSSDELFELAKKRKEEEKALVQAESKAKIEALKAKRKEMVSQFNKELSNLDAEIKKLGGRASRKAAAGGGAGTNNNSTRTPGISAKIVEIVKAKGQASTKDITAGLTAAGVQAKNLSQTMAYLKRKGDLVSIGHGMYAPAG